MNVRIKKIVSFLLAMTFLLSLVPVCFAAGALEGYDALELGVPYVVNAAGEVIITFTPEKDGVYAFYSEYDTEVGHVDPFVALYDSWEAYESGDHFGYDDDYDDTNNFRIAKTLKKDQEYILVADVYTWYDVPYTINVEELSLEAIYIRDGDFHMFANSYHTVSVDFEPYGATGELEWTVSDETMAELYVEPGFLDSVEVKALKPGTVTLTATCGELSDSITIEILPTVPLVEYRGKVVFEAEMEEVVFEVKVEEEGVYRLNINTQNPVTYEFYNDVESFGKYTVEEQCSEEYYLAEDSYYIYVASEYTEGAVFDVSVEKVALPEKSQFVDESITISRYDHIFIDYIEAYDDFDQCVVFTEDDMFFRHDNPYSADIGTHILSLCKYDADMDSYLILDTLEVNVVDSPEVELDSVTNVTFKEGEQRGFKFVAPEDGTYLFWSSGDPKNDPRLEIYGIDGTWLSGDDDGGLGYHFVCEFDMEKDEAVYLRLKGYDDVTTFDLHVNKNDIYPTAVDIFVKDAYIAKMEGETYYVQVNEGIGVEEYKDPIGYFGLQYAFNAPEGYYNNGTFIIKSSDEDIAEVDYASSGEAGVVIYSEGKVDLTIEYTDADGVTISKTITIVIVNPIYGDVNFDGKFDGFDVAMAIGIISGDDATVLQYIKMLFTDDCFVNVDDVYAMVEMLATDENDETAPVINGLEDGKTYNEDVYFTVSEQDVKSVTVNGVECSSGLMFDDELGFVNFIEETLILTDVSTEYTVVATDYMGNQTIVKVVVEPKKEEPPVTPENPENPDNPGDSDDGEVEPALEIGDINGNEKIDMTDYILLKRSYFGTFKFTDAQFKAGDINKNDKIDMTDYILLKRAYFGTFTIK